MAPIKSPKLKRILCQKWGQIFVFKRLTALQLVSFHWPEISIGVLFQWGESLTIGSFLFSAAYLLTRLSICLCFIPRFTFLYVHSSCTCLFIVPLIPILGTHFWSQIAKTALLLRTEIKIFSVGFVICHCGLTNSTILRK